MQFSKLNAISIICIASLYAIWAVPTPSIEVPTASTVWTAGTLGNISWAIPSGVTDKNLVSIGLYRNSFDSGRLPLMSVVDNALLSSGTVNWNVPLELAPGNDYIVRLNVGPQLISSDAFTIKQPAVSVIYSVGSTTASLPIPSSTGIKEANNATSSAALAYTRSGNTFWLSVVLATIVAIVAVCLL